MDVRGSLNARRARPATAHNHPNGRCVIVRLHRVMQAPTLGCTGGRTFPSRRADERRIDTPGCAVAVRPPSPPAEGRGMAAPRPDTRPRSGPTRRGVLTGAAATGAALSVPLQLIDPPAAQAVYLPAVRHYPRTVLPSASLLHMANRFTYGYTPALRREI